MPVRSCTEEPETGPEFDSAGARGARIQREIFHAQPCFDQFSTRTRARSFFERNRLADALGILGNAQASPFDTSGYRSSPRSTTGSRRSLSCL